MGRFCSHNMLVVYVHCLCFVEFMSNLCRHCVVASSLHVCPEDHIRHIVDIDWMLTLLSVVRCGLFLPSSSCAHQQVLSSAVLVGSASARCVRACRPICARSPRDVGHVRQERHRPRRVGRPQPHGQRVFERTGVVFGGAADCRLEGQGRVGRRPGRLDQVVHEHQGLYSLCGDPISYDSIARLAWFWVWPQSPRSTNPMVSPHRARSPWCRNIPWCRRIGMNLSLG